MVTCALLLLAHNDPQSHLWLPGLGIARRSIASEATKIPLHWPMGIKARVNSLPALFCRLHAMIPRVISGCLRSQWFYGGHDGDNIITKAVGVNVSRCNFMI